jgi:hypothetical protein
MIMMLPRRKSIEVIRFLIIVLIQVFGMRLKVALLINDFDKPFPQKSAKVIK